MALQKRGSDSSENGHDDSTVPLVRIKGTLDYKAQNGVSGSDPIGTPVDMSEYNMIATVKSADQTSVDCLSSLNSLPRCFDKHHHHHHTQPKGSADSRKKRSKSKDSGLDKGRYSGDFSLSTTECSLGSSCPVFERRYCSGSSPNIASSLQSLDPRTIRMEEIAPSNGMLIDSHKSTDWRMSLTQFSQVKHGQQSADKSLPKSIRKYYKEQDELISAYEKMINDVDMDEQETNQILKLSQRAKLLAQLSFGCNLLLLIAKLVAAVLSGSLAIVSSVVDSAVDLVSGALMWWSNRTMKRKDPYHYPQGRTRLEPVAIIVLSVVMSLASVQVIRESVEVIIAYAKENVEGPKVGIPTIVIICATIVVKLVLFILCHKVKTPSTGALAQDHRNDVLSNSIALGAGLLGYHVWKYSDPIGAILISIYIIVSWFITGNEQMKLLIGHTAQPDFLKRITWLALNHHPKILLIDTVRAFHFGNDFLVEVDVVLPQDLQLQEAHDIGETLQTKIEKLPVVERCFVHLDYECKHDPKTEHKVV